MSEGDFAGGTDAIFALKGVFLSEKGDFRARRVHSLAEGAPYLLKRAQSGAKRAYFRARRVPLLVEWAPFLLRVCHHWRNGAFSCQKGAYADRRGVVSAWNGAVVVEKGTFLYQKGNFAGRKAPKYRLKIDSSRDTRQIEMKVDALAPSAQRRQFLLGRGSQPLHSLT